MNIDVHCTSAEGILASKQLPHILTQQLRASVGSTAAITEDDRKVITSLAQCQKVELNDDQLQRLYVIAVEAHRLWERIAQSMDKNAKTKSINDTMLKLIHTFECGMQGLAKTYLERNPHALPEPFLSVKDRVLGCLGISLALANNEKSIGNELLETCPNIDDTWMQLAKDLLGCKKPFLPSAWHWKSENLLVRERQLEVFDSVANDILLPDTNKWQVLGWLLSTMLEEVPQE